MDKWISRSFQNDKTEWGSALVKIKKAMPIENNERVSKSVELRSVISRLNEHCVSIKRLSDAFEAAQDNNPNFSINQPFDPTRSSMTRTVLMNMVAIYEAIRSDLQRITRIRDTEFQNLFPKLDINFETYYSVALSLLNLIYQMQHMKIYCRHLLSPDILQS
jgi:hypothetical protein